MESRWNETIERLFQERNEAETREAYRLATVLAMLLFPAFSILDWITQREHFWTLTLIRYCATVLFLGLHWAARHRKYPGSPFVSGVVILFFASAFITAMCMALGGYASPYYAGVNLVVLAGVVLFPWNARKMAIATGITLAVYLLGVLITARFSISDPAIFVNNLGFLVATAIIGVSSAGLSDRLRRQAFARLVEVERAREDLKRYDQIRSRFFANVSHELRTPLTLILGPTARLLSEPGISSEQASQLELIERNSRLLLKHVNDLLDVARIEEGRMTMDYRRADVAALVRQVASNFDHLAREKGIRFVVAAPAGVQAEVDPAKLQRVLMNLLSNAFKFTPDGGTIRCTAGAREGGRVELRVADSGPGIPPEHRSAVFARFFQVEESLRRHHGGTGLGLAIVKEFVELHRGQVEAAQAAEGGAEFRVEIPARAPAGSEVGSWQPDEDGSEAAPPIARSARDSLSREPEADATRALVLIVEDNPEMRSYIASVLKPRFRVAIAEGGRDGVELAMRLKPDLVLSDVMMPDISGEDLLRALRASRELDAVPIVMLTAKADEETRIHLMREGAQDYVLKPFSAEELVTRIANLVALKRSREILSAELQSKETELESLARETVRRKDKLERAVRFIRAARDEARQALESRDEFISIASHELKTPVTAMKLQNDVVRLRVSKLGADSPAFRLFKSWADRSDAQLGRILRLVEDMLDVSRINTGKFQLDLKPTELMDVVQDAIDRVSSQLVSAKIQLDFQAGTPVHGNWDGFRLEQVVTNLLGNAAKYAPGSRVEVRVFRESDQAFIQVKDNGAGIEASKQERIFRRFERATDAKGVTGLGLGLYICRRIVEDHGGEITVKSGPGQGSCFTVRLPIAAAAEKES